MASHSIDEQIALIRRGCVDLIDENELRQKLAEDRPLIVKAGFDPTAPDLHLGHTVLMQKLSHFQQLGHEVQFLIGDFTGMIGDPSGKNETRKMLTREEVMANAETYKTQIFKILDREKTKIVFNSHWLGKLDVRSLMELAGKTTVARMLERDDFHQRYTSGGEISLVEFFYPLFQGYDSVFMKADVELGGTDQKFNLLMGRTLQRRYGQEQQIVLTMPILEGTDGVNKMSKSLGNYIGVTEAPNDMFGKIMSISDELMFRYFELLSDRTLETIEQMRCSIKDGSSHPKEVKATLGREIVDRYHGEGAGIKAQQYFEQVFAKGENPEDMPAFTFALNSADRRLSTFIASIGFAKSNGEARRLIEQGAVSLDGTVIRDSAYELQQPGECVLKVGKRRFGQLTVQ
ncbi:tyrosine--tRNA ligase [Desulfurispira natronophila]|uniref:Tyrosine--tRNA ligase n=1 Tax=Desulfurispira natronophila TaxID=682562 RepID=A0A7W7Y2V2_9BACT|nr:tyrosine--tRNA ligase [Desulfurispira natronophila]MBB5021058.1 tyrosyl-tRNA synthetase [Desulfurispira natronophila]